jgi:hypothetical protein
MACSVVIKPPYTKRAEQGRKGMAQIQIGIGSARKKCSPMAHMHWCNHSTLGCTTGMCMQTFMDASCTCTGCPKQAKEKKSTHPASAQLNKVHATGNSTQRCEHLHTCNPFLFCRGQRNSHNACNYFMAQAGWGEGRQRKTRSILML